ncbi:MAG: transposase [Fibromonadaceae bacterium]|jgi:REP element-mobilizing transposase RayT|nr:transposase [Fibromonadaceae bacterium]
MKYDPNIHKRRSIRLRNFDYTNPGSYFVTICLNQRIPKIWLNAADMAYNTTAHWQNIVVEHNTVAGQPRRAAPTIPMADINFDFPTFGMVENEIILLNDAGKMAQQTWHEMAGHYSNIEIDEFIIMPDHIHWIITITANANNNPISLPELVYYFKTRTTNKYTDGVKALNWMPFNKKLWQRNYYEHVIRNETEYAAIAGYIRENPILWGKEHLKAVLRQ